MPKAPAKPRAKKTVPESAFTATLTIGGVPHIGAGDTILEAIKAIRSPEKVMGKGTLVVTDGKKSADFLFQVLPLRRLITNEVTKIMFAKWASVRLK